MTEPGVVMGVLLAITGLTVWFAARGAANGRLRRNPLVGIRLPSTMKNESAWVAGHRAAQRPFKRAAIVALTGAPVVIVVPHEGAAALIGLAALLVVGGFVLYGASVANRVARNY